MPDAVTWDDPAFFVALGDLDSSWRVEDRTAAVALPFHNASVAQRLGAASLQSVSWRPAVDHELIDETPFLSMGESSDPAAGRAATPRAVLVAAADTPQDMLAALMEPFLQSVLGRQDVRAEVEAWVAGNTEAGYRMNDTGRVDMHIFRVELAPQLALEQLFAQVKPAALGDSPRYAGEGWTFSFQPVMRTATKGNDTFQADMLGFASYSRAWVGEVPEDAVLADFHAAYARLGLGAPPKDVRIQGAIC